MKQDHYAVKVMCGNCKHEEELEIPKGTTIKDFVETGTQLIKCSKCRCSLSDVKYKIIG